MNQALIIGDTHFDDKYEGYLETQVATIKETIKDIDIEDVIFLGDISDKRKPKPTILLAINELLSSIKGRKIHILRGNHDSNDKSDDGITYLSLFESKNVKVYNHIKDVKIKNRNFTFIPHYENEQIIIDKHTSIPDSNIVVGHYGYIGCINGVPDYAFSISPSVIRSFTILGHIHRNSRSGLINVVGTPYPISFYDTEANCASVGILNFDADNEALDYYSLKTGPRYVTVHSNNLSELRKLNPNCYNIVRVLLDSDSDKYAPDIIKDIITAYPVKWVDIRVVPKMDKIPMEKDNISIKAMFDKSVLDQYLSQVNMPYSLEDMMKVYQHIRNEN